MCDPDGARLVVQHCMMGGGGFSPDRPRDFIRFSRKLSSRFSKDGLSARNGRVITVTVLCWECWPGKAAEKNTVKGVSIFR